MRGSRRLLTAGLGVALSAISLWLAARTVDVDQMADAFAQVDWLPIVATLVPGTLAYVFMGLRSRTMFAPVGAYRFSDHVRAHFVAFIGNTLFPFRVGELLRIDYLAKVGGARHSACVGGLVAERLLDMLVMLICFGLSIPLTTGAIDATTGIVLLAVLTASALAALVTVGRFPRHALRAVQWLSSALGARASARVRVAGDAFVEGLSTVGSVGGLTAVGLWTIARWCLPFVTIRLWLAAFGIELPWFAPIVLLASLAFGTALPAATAFIGTYHYALTAGLSLLGVADSLAVSVAIVAHATATLPYMMIGFTVAAIEVARGRLVIGAPAAKNPDGRRDTGEDLRR